MSPGSIPAEKAKPKAVGDAPVHTRSVTRKKPMPW
jgi:hypothetical protein